MKCLTGSSVDNFNLFSPAMIVNQEVPAITVRLQIQAKGDGHCKIYNGDRTVFHGYGYMSMPAFGPPPVLQTLKIPKDNGLNYLAGDLISVVFDFFYPSGDFKLASITIDTSGDGIIAH